MHWVRCMTTGLSLAAATFSAAAAVHGDGGDLAVPARAGAEAAVRVVTAGELVAGRYKITAIVEIYKGEELVSMVGVTDAQSGHSFLLSGRKAYADLELVSADYDKQEVVLRNKDLLYAVNLLASSAGLPAAVAQPALRRPGVMGTPNPREEEAQARRRARYAQPPP